MRSICGARALQRDGRVSDLESATPPAVTVFGFVWLAIASRSLATAELVSSVPGLVAVVVVMSWPRKPWKLGTFDQSSFVVMRPVLLQS